MRNTIVRVAGLLLVLALGLGSSACAARTINQVLADPARYRDRQVKLQGSVVNSFSAVGTGAYELEDRTGRLWIVSNQGVPRRGANVSVKGTVREGFNLGGLGDLIRLPQAIGSGVVLMESSHKAKN
jgi:hypothetical protein